MDNLKSFDLNMKQMYGIYSDLIKTGF